MGNVLEHVLMPASRTVWMLPDIVILWYPKYRLTETGWVQLIGTNGFKQAMRLQAQRKIIIWWPPQAEATKLHENCLKGIERNILPKFFLSMEFLLYWWLLEFKVLYKIQILLGHTAVWLRCTRHLAELCGQGLGRRWIRGRGALSGHTGYFTPVIV